MLDLNFNEYIKQLLGMQYNWFFICQLFGDASDTLNFPFATLE